MADYTEAGTVEDACALLARHGGDAMPLAGGTGVVLMQQQGLIEPDMLVRIGRIGELRQVAQTSRCLRIGAGTTLHEVARHPAVRWAAPALARACGSVGNTRIRHWATLGGNLCEADYASDPPATLAALGATCVVVGDGRQRLVPAEDVITDFYETSLEDDELITRIVVPVDPRRRQTYLKFKSRSAEDRPCVGVAAAADIAPDGTVDRLRVHVGAVAATPQEVPEALALARGRPLDTASASAVADGYADAIDPLDDIRGSAWYRKRVIAVLVRRALEQLAAATPPLGGSDHG